MPYSDVSASFVGGELGALNIVRCGNSSVPCLEGDIAGYNFLFFRNHHFLRKNAKKVKF